MMGDLLLGDGANAKDCSLEDDCMVPVSGNI